MHSGASALAGRSVSASASRVANAQNAQCLLRVASAFLRLSSIEFVLSVWSVASWCGPTLVGRRSYACVVRRAHLCTHLRPMSPSIGWPRSVDPTTTPHHYSLCTQHLSLNPQPRTPHVLEEELCHVDERSVSDRRIVGHDRLYRNRESNRNPSILLLLTEERTRSRLRGRSRCHARARRCVCTSEHIHLLGVNGHLTLNSVVSLTHNALSMLWRSLPHLSRQFYGSASAQFAHRKRRRRHQHDTAVASSVVSVQ